MAVPGRYFPSYPTALSSLFEPFRALSSLSVRPEKPGPASAESECKKWGVRTLHPGACREESWVSQNRGRSTLYYHCSKFWYLIVHSRMSSVRFLRGPRGWELSCARRRNQQLRLPQQSLWAPQGQRQRVGGYLGPLGTSSRPKPWAKVLGTLVGQDWLASLKAKRAPTSEASIRKLFGPEVYSDKNKLNS